MPGCGNSGSKEEEIFGETGVENVHGAHPSAGVDEHPSRIRYDACSVALSQLAFDLFVSDLVTLTLYWDPFRRSSYSFYVLTGVLFGYGRDSVVIERIRLGVDPQVD